jgi:ubiquinone/menaquinone biosynthesis C-methylase UbiE
MYNKTAEILMAKQKSQFQKIRRFWKEQAEKHGTAQKASWGDLLVQKEVSVLTQYLKDGEKVLDVGCANGYSSIELAKKRKIRLIGIDYVPEMIKNANLAKKRLSKEVKNRLSFKVGNVLKPDFHNNSFDKVISTRCLCNLISWKQQSQAVFAIWKLLKPGGTLLLSEPTKQGLEKLNSLGNKIGLKPLAPPWHNLYLDEEKLINFVRPYFKIEIKYFSSTYYLTSRIIYRRLMQDNAKRLRQNSIFNKIGILLPNFGNWGVQRLYILTKLSKTTNEA